MLDCRLSIVDCETIVAINDILLTLGKTSSTRLISRSPQTKTNSEADVFIPAQYKRIAYANSICIGN